MILKFFLLILTLLFLKVTYAEIHKDTIDFTTFNNLCLDTNEITIDNKVILFKKEDKKLLSDHDGYTFNNFDIEIHSRININNSSIIFDDSISLNLYLAPSAINLTFKNVHVLGNISIDGQKSLFADEFRPCIIHDCVFKGNSEFMSFGNFYFSKTEFKKPVSIENSNQTIIHAINITECTFNNLTQNNWYLNSSLSIQNYELTPIQELEILNCQFNHNHEINQDLSLELLGKFESIELSSNKLSYLGLSKLTVLSTLFIDSCSISDRFYMENLNIRPESAYIPWDLIKGNKIGVFGKTKIVNNDSTNKLSNFNYSQLISSYNKLFNIYKNRGDLISANGCYVEMKDIETEKLKYLYASNKNFESYLYYKLNVFLKFFANYGTSPVRSIQVSIWVILLFSCFYFFSPSEWDKISSKYLISQGEKLITYFTTEQKLEELYSSKHKDNLRTFSQFKKNLKKSKKKVPFFFSFFLSPLYFFSVIKLTSNKTLYRSIEFLKGRWIDLPFLKKIFLGLFTFLSITFYCVYLFLVRGFNSITLSINTFTTLGFGDIPVVGLSRYIAIIEGFLGWFLLSIFSVSLIGQILQN